MAAPADDESTIHEMEELRDTLIQGSGDYKLFDEIIEIARRHSPTREDVEDAIEGVLIGHLPALQGVRHPTHPAPCECDDYQNEARTTHQTRVLTDAVVALLNGENR